MKALSLLQPFASLIAIGLKSIETRSWATAYRGPLVIHASARLGRAEKELCWEPPFVGELAFERNLINCRPDGKLEYFLPLGAIIAICNLVDCRKILLHSADGTFLRTEASDANIYTKPPYENVKEQFITEDEFAFGDYTPGRFAWFLKDVQKIEPVLCKGNRKLWNLPDELVVNIAA